MKLADIQHTIHALVRGEVGAEDAAATLGVDPRRLAIYRDFAHGHVRSALDNVYEITRALLGDRWGALCAAYVAEHPPSHWTLNAAAEAFPEFLEGRPGRAGVDPFHVALAQLEWEQYAVLVDPAETEPPTGGQCLNPTLSLLQLPYPVVPFVVAHGADPATPMPGPSPALAVLWRHPATHNCVFRHADDALLLAIKIVHEALPLDQVAETLRCPVGAVERVVDEAVAMGLVLVA